MGDSWKAEIADQRAPVQGWQAQEENQPRHESLFSF